MTFSGKLVIIAILAIALAAASTSWWFRFNATHRAARLWGPDGARLIRDAPTVYLNKIPSPGPAGLFGATDVGYDISKARGLTHLRNALLEDRSFDWSKDHAPATERANSKWGLDFIGDGKAEQFTIVFTDDCRWAAVRGTDLNPPRMVSTEPIAAGLHEFFSEAWSEATGTQR